MSGGYARRSCPERAPAEVRQVGTSVIAPDVAVYNPAFDVTPHRYVAAIITEHGVVTALFDAGLERIRTAASTERSRGAGPVPPVY